jgi:thiamine pyrophosphokinase
VSAPPPARTALVFAGGDPVPSSVLPRLPAGETLVVAADSGVEHALALGQRVDLVVGDLDSADPAAVAKVEADGAVVEQHAAEKDQTDLELALRAAVARGATRLVVVGGYGGRLDHFLANALVLAGDAAGEVAIEWVTGNALVTVVHDHATLTGRAGDLCSLVAVGGTARGVRTRALRYPLDDDDLLPGSTRGVSNELAAPTAEVWVDDGTVLAIQPDPDSPTAERT